jgi:hypothetical protein
LSVKGKAGVNFRRLRQNMEMNLLGVRDGKQSSPLGKAQHIYISSKGLLLGDMGRIVEGEAAHTRAIELEPNFFESPPQSRNTLKRSQMMQSPR